MLCCYVVYAILIVIIYKILDRLVRIPRLGRYSERYIFVTGCDTGFGNILAKRLDQLGCHVFAGCFTEKGETDLKKSASNRLHAIPLNVTKTESIQKAMEYVKSNLPSGKGLWGVVNNAGVLSCLGVVEWLRLNDFKTHCEVNLWGPVEVSLAFLPLIKKQKGRIVNTASVLGRMTYGDCVPYCISKYGVESFTDGLRRCLRVFGCKACLVEPGQYKTSIATAEGVNEYWRKSFENADPQLKAEYGEAYLQKIIDSQKFLGTPSDRLTDVVDAYQHALFGRFPRARYMVGWDAVYIYYPIQLLPEWLGDWILEIFMKRPLPAAVSK